MVMPNYRNLLWTQTCYITGHTSVKLAGQLDNLEQVSRSFIYNKLFIKKYFPGTWRNATEASCDNLFFMPKFLSRCPANFTQELSCYFMYKPLEFTSNRMSDTNFRNK